MGFDKGIQGFLIGWFLAIHSTSRQQCPGFDVSVDLQCLLFLSLLFILVCRVSIVHLLTNKTTHEKCEALQESVSHKQTISRHIASADLASVTAPGRQVWPVPCLPEVQLALPVKPAKPLSPGNRLRGHLSFWINGHTCTPTCPQSCHTARREEEKKGERDWTLPGWLMT